MAMKIINCLQKEKKVLIKETKMLCIKICVGLSYLWGGGGGGVVYEVPECPTWYKIVSLLLE